MTVARRVLFSKLSLTLFRSIESATAFAKLRGNSYVELVHWLHQLWQLPDGDIQRIAVHHGLDADQLGRDLIASLDALPQDSSGLKDFSHVVLESIEQAWIYASLHMDDTHIRSAWLLGGLLNSPALRSRLFALSPQWRKIPVPGINDAWTDVIATSPEATDASMAASGLPIDSPGHASNALKDDLHNRKDSALARYCTDLTAQARDGKIDPVIGREREVNAMIDILLRRRQNNPLLTGEAGVGKTAVVEGLARSIAADQVPPSLRSVRLLSLDVGALIAGASMRGEFEARLKSVLEEATSAAQPVILFIDEVHTLIGAGGQAGTGDAANLLKPALARGTLRTIGATTWSEYKRHIEKDPALTRRFQVLQVLEPAEAQAAAMVRSLVPSFKQHHGVFILDEAVRAAVSLSQRYIPARQLPDKAISLLDTACARVAMSLHTPPQVVRQLREQMEVLRAEANMVAEEAPSGCEETHAPLIAIQERLRLAETDLALQEARWQAELALAQRLRALRDAEFKGDHVEEDAATVNADASTARQAQQHLVDELRALQGDHPLVHPLVDAAVVAGVVSEWTNIPVGRMVRDDIRAVLGLQAQLEQRVVGQSSALAQIAQRIKTSRSGLTDPGMPIGVFLLVGPSGVGKTETALALAQAMYGGEHNLITINMSEYQEAHTISSLKGAPPGYVGHGEGGVLTEAVRRRPYSVVLLDEIEKAHPDVHELFYQVFDKGWMEDGDGRVIDFRNTLILLTSNAGSDLITELAHDPDLLPTTTTLVDMLMPELRKVFPAAFVGRLTVAPYVPLSTEVLSDIVGLQLQRIGQRLQSQHGIELAIDPLVIDHIVAVCGTHETGARRLGQYILQNLLPQLADLWLDSVRNQQVIHQINVSVALDTATAAHVGGLRCIAVGPPDG